STVVVSAQTSPTGDEVTTYFGPWLICAATRSFGSVTSGQWPAKVSKVLRPSSSAEVYENQWPAARPQPSSETGISQPPRSKPPRVSSSGPPGDWETPSRVMNRLMLSLIVESFALCRPCRSDG